VLRLILALAAILMFTPIAAAASFDCDKAQTAFERAVCTDPTLSHQDEVLAKAYATALGGLSDGAAAQMKATQHAWLDHAERVCSVDAEPISDTYNDDQIACLQTTYRSRIQALETSRMLGDYRFYPEEAYLLEKDTEAADDAFNKVAEKHFQTIKIDGGEEDGLAAAFNQLTEDLRVGYTDYFPDGQAAFAPGDVTEDVDISTIVKSVSDYRITLQTTNYSYGHGAAHGNYGISYAHFLVSEQRALKASDIFAKQGWQTTLAKLVIARVKEQMGDGYFADSEADIPNWVADPSRWDFSSDGLIIQFQPYEVAAYAAGAVTVTLRWDEIRDLLAENGEQIGSY